MKRFLLHYLGCCCISLFSLSSFAQVRLPRLVSSGMVLQRDKPVNIWGWASAGEKITVSFNNNTWTTAAVDDGEWSVVLPPMKAGGPYDMKISGINTITLDNILVGEVWVCSGQSNMELPMERVRDKYEDVIANSTNSLIRQFNDDTRYNFQSPQQDLASGAWEMANPQSVLHFSATAYFFARQLYEKYHVAIGLIKASAGGAPIEAWLSEDALRAFPAYLSVAQKWKNNNYLDSVRKADNAVSNNWYNRLWQDDQGLHEEKKWYDSDYDASAWPVMRMPGLWENKGLPSMYGVVWMRKEINLPASVAGKPGRLLLGTIIDRDSTYINGVFTGTTGYQYPPRKYTIAAGLLRPGKNILTIRIINGAARGGFTEGKSYKLIVDGQSYDLTGDWQYRVGAVEKPLPGSVTFQYQPLGLFNGMIAPLLSYTIKGVIWYQGEANTWKAAEYQKLLPALISNWRQKWNEGDFPFLYMQLPNFMPTKTQPSESQWAELREAQLKTLSVPATGMAVAIDIGEWNDIHPLNKGEVGRRLALVAEAIAYGSGITWSGPIYHSMKTEGNKIILSFKHTGKGLVAKGSDSLHYFTIAGPDKKFVWAKAIIKNNKVVVWNDEVPHPVAVRYAWADNPEGANLCNKEGLPASPFGTDQ